MVCVEVGAAPIIRPNYLSTPEDTQVAVESLRLVREIMQQDAFRAYSPEEVRPGLSLHSHDELVSAARGGNYVYWY